MCSAFTLSILMCLTATTIAEHHQPCHSPNMTGFLSVFDAKNHIFKALGKYFYDPLAKKLRFKTNDTESINTTLSMDVLMVFDEGVFYEIDGKNQSCEKKSLHSLLHPLEVPTGSKHVSEVVLGSAIVEEEGLKLDIWMGTVPETEEAKITISTTQRCLPVSILYLCDTASLLFSNTFVETEIKDPDSLKVPSFCEDEAVEVTPEGTENSFFHLFI